MSYMLEGDEQERKLFVGGFNKETTDEDQLKTYFEHYGAIVDCTILRDAEKRSRGFGFVLFEDAETVDKIMRAKKSGTRFCIDEGDTTNMEVKRALPKGSREPMSRDRPTVSSRSAALYNKVFVGGLPSSITEDELRQHFEAYGRVSQIELLRDRETNRLRGFAFVAFEDEDSADKCIQRRSHEICRKICEVKRAHHKNADNKDANGGGGGARRSDGGYENRNRDIGMMGRQQGLPSSGGGDVNTLIQQAFLMGQQSVYQQAGLQPPAATQLNLGLGGLAAANSLAQPANNILLQALANQQLAPAVAPVAPVVAPVAPAPATSGSADTLAQLAQLLQSGGVDPNALGALLKGESAGQRTSSSGGGASSNNGYPTAYPPVSMYNQSSNYGPSKYDDQKRGYRPY